MNDQQGLRDALTSLVPDPPPTRDWGAGSRGLARRRRVRRIATAAAAVVLVAVAVPVVRSLGGSDHPRTLDVTTHGTGPVACRGLRAAGLGSSVDSRTVDGGTAATWLRETGDSSLASDVVDEQAATVCVMERRLTFSVVVARPGHHAVVVQQGDYRSVIAPMAKLDTLAKGGATTTDAPFRCPTSPETADQDVANFLPSGATGALLCYDTPYAYSPRAILEGTDLDALVLAVDKAPVSYVAPNIDCSGVGIRTYSLVFRYPSGTRTVSMEECRGLAIGRYTRNATLDLDLMFEHALVPKLLTHGPGPQPPRCPAPGSSPQGTGDLRHLIRASYCPDGSTTGRSLTAAELTRLQRWGSTLENASTGIEGPCTRPAAGWPHLALVDVWGNQFTMTLACHGRIYPVTRMPDGSGQLTYPLGDQAIVERLLRQLAAG